MRFELDLLGNAEDYVEQSLELAWTADEYGTHKIEHSMLDNKVKWKTAFVLLVQGFEILLKYGLSQINDILIYEDIDNRNINSAKTVNVNKAIQRLINFGRFPFSEKENEFIKRCIETRNEYVHYKVEIESEKIKSRYASLYQYYLKAYNIYSQRVYCPKSAKAQNMADNLLRFAEKFIIFRGEEVLKNQFESILKEIEQWENHDYFETSDGKKVLRIRYGSEKVYKEAEIHPYTYCDDCGTEIGKYHLPICDLEECPLCHGQKLSCECDIELPGYYEE